MKRLSLFLFLVSLTATFALSNVALAGEAINGAHFNLNVIGFNKCTQKDAGVYPNCFKGNAGDIQTNGHTIFVPLKTAQTEAICDNPNSIIPIDQYGDFYTTAYLQKGVRILVSDAGGDDIQVVDRDATDGEARLNLPDGTYVIMARALGKPGGCMDIDTIICWDWNGTTYVRADCAMTGIEKYTLVGHLNVDRIKGTKASWINATPELLPVETGVGSGEAGYFDFYWQIYNDNLRLLQLRIYRTGPPA